jgi:hypothetical protein
MLADIQDSYGPKGAKSGRTTISLGAVYSSVAGQPLLVCGQAKAATDPSAFESKSGEICSASQPDPVTDSFTGYAAPGGIEFAWGNSKASASLKVDKLGITEGEGGLIEKVDVLAEIPYVIRKTLAAVTGTKPYIYQVSDLYEHSCCHGLTDSTSTKPPCTSRWKVRRRLSTDGFSTRHPSFRSRCPVLGGSPSQHQRPGVLGICALLFHTYINSDLIQSSAAGCRQRQMYRYSNEAGCTAFCGAMLA